MTDASEQAGSTALADPGHGPDGAAATVPAPDAGGKAARAKTTPPIGRLVQLATALAAVLALVFGLLWLTSRDGSGHLARERDAALSAAQQAAVNLNTLDYRAANQGLDLWMKTATGQVLDEFTKNRADYVKIVTESKRATTAAATDGAVSELDDRAGIARVLVGVDVTVTPEGQPPTVTRQRMQMEMTRTDGGWKVSKLAPVRTPGSAPGN